MYSQKRFSQASLQISTKYFQSWIIMLCLELCYSVEKYSWKHEEQHISKRNNDITVVGEIHTYFHIHPHIPTGDGKTANLFYSASLFNFEVCTTIEFFEINASLTYRKSESFRGVAYWLVWGKESVGRKRGDGGGGGVIYCQLHNLRSAPAGQVDLSGHAYLSIREQLV